MKRILFQLPFHGKRQMKWSKLKVWVTFMYVNRDELNLLVLAEA